MQLQLLLVPHVVSFIPHDKVTVVAAMLSQLTALASVTEIVHVFSKRCHPVTTTHSLIVSGVPRYFVQGRESTNSVEDRGQRERGSGGGNPLVRGSGGSCNFVQKISCHIVKFSQFLVLQTIYVDNQIICHC